MKKMVIATLVVIVMVLSLYNQMSSESTISETINGLKMDEIGSAVLYSHIAKDGFVMTKEEAVELLSVLVKSGEDAERRQAKDFYYIEIIIYSEDGRDLLTLSCINATGTEKNKNEQILIDDMTYESRQFYKVLYDIGVSHDYFLNLRKK